MGTPRKKTLEDFNAYGTFANTSQESILVLESWAGSSDFMKDVGGRHQSNCYCISRLLQLDASDEREGSCQLKLEPLTISSA